MLEEKMIYTRRNDIENLVRAGSYIKQLHPSVLFDLTEIKNYRGTNYQVSLSLASNNPSDSSYLLGALQTLIDTAGLPSASGKSELVRSVAEAYSNKAAKIERLPPISRDELYERALPKV